MSSVDKEEKWSKIQERVFIKWCNGILSKRNHSKVKAVETDFQDGTRLLQIVEILTGREFQYTKEPKNEQDKIANLEIFDKFMQKEGKCANIGK